MGHRTRARAYLAGKMSGLADYGFPAFHDAAKDLRDRGWEIVSPAELDGDPPPRVLPGDASYNQLLARDVQIVADPGTDAVIALPNWRESQGALLETRVAFGLGKPVLEYPDLFTVHEHPEIPVVPQPADAETVLEEAARLVDGDRGRDYGHPYHDFSRTAQMMSAILDSPVRPDQVPLLMICVKLSRLCQTPGKRDSVVDVAGYARTLEMVQQHPEFTG